MSFFSELKDCKFCCLCSVDCINVSKAIFDILVNNCIVSKSHNDLLLEKSKLFFCRRLNLSDDLERVGQIFSDFVFLVNYDRDVDKLQVYKYM